MSNLMPGPPCYCVAIAPGCHSGPWSSVISRHKTMTAAKKAAQDQRRVVVHFSWTPSIGYEFPLERKEVL